MVLCMTVRRLLASLNEGKATGSDGLPTVMLKTCSDALADSLTVMTSPYRKAAFPLPTSLLVCV